MEARRWNSDLKRDAWRGVVERWAGGGRAGRFTIGELIVIQALSGVCVYDDSENRR